MITDRQPAAAWLRRANATRLDTQFSFRTLIVQGSRWSTIGDVGRFAPMPGEAPALARALTPCRNDLTEAAIDLVPEIATVLARLGRLPGSLLARMSGSGATCFALFADRAAALAAWQLLALAEPGWWSAAGALTPGLAAIGG